MPVPRLRPRARTALAGLVLSTATALLPATAAHAAPPPPQPPPAGLPTAPTPTATDLTALRAAAAATQRRLAAGTRDYQAGQRTLASARAAAQAARQAAQAAATAAAHSQQVLDDYAAAAYRRGLPSDLELLLSLDPADPAAALTSAGWLQHAGEHENEHLTGAQRDRDAAATLAAWAVTLAAAADRAATDQAQRLTRLRAAARTAAGQLSAAVEAVEAARIKGEQARRARQGAARQALGAGTLPSGCGRPGSGAGAGTAWGGYPNGLIPADALCPLPGAPGQLLRRDAAAGFVRLNAAYTARFGTGICVTDAYRSYAEQVRLYAVKPNLAAIPGTSNHGWGLAVDLCGGIQSFSTSQHTWMTGNAARYGWIHPSWANPGGSRPEPWHWEFGRL